MFRFLENSFTNEYNGTLQQMYQGEAEVGICFFVDFVVVDFVVLIFFIFALYQCDFQFCQVGNAINIQLSLEDTGGVFRSKLDGCFFVF